MSVILPRMLAMHMFKHNYRMILASAYRRLLANVKFYEVKKYHRKRDYYFELERQRVRMRKLIKMFLKINKRRTMTFFDKWKMQTELRKTVLANYSAIFEEDNKNQLE